ncbi:hypothetical protein [Spongiactinospora sp. TRM90649]|uniref:hypothetical protein n=1 Tax=Spongiactinospora sp. TRM90649 TaxID=3031114 RepID=UPI0023F7F96A|nr:hypothetical protein [Spongiactinospora sp. TRM90649]MDF5758579.1 hypothetical protein [Spongiactinospora sp. TRM90649]
MTSLFRRYLLSLVGMRVSRDAPASPALCRCAELQAELDHAQEAREQLQKDLAQARTDYERLRAARHLSVDPAAVRSLLDRLTAIEVPDAHLQATGHGPRAELMRERATNWRLTEELLRRTHADIDAERRWR